jgi:hypothetical protein
MRLQSVIKLWFDMFNSHNIDAEFPIARGILPHSCVMLMPTKMRFPA